jgi:hypothetical protein
MKKKYEENEIGIQIEDTENEDEIVFSVAYIEKKSGRKTAAGLCHIKIRHQGKDCQMNIEVTAEDMAYVLVLGDFLAEISDQIEKNNKKKG